MTQRRNGHARWHGWLAWALQGLYAACLLGLLVLPAQRYGWMREIDPVFGGPVPEDGSGNRTIAVMLLLAGALLAQAAVAATTAKPRVRWLALGLALLVAGVWALRFGTS